jgi:hypothetical protein
MTDQWLAEITTTHQDHVIAHVIGSSVLGYFVHEEAAHLVLDMGFIWTMYLDGQMMLLPQSVATSELDAAAEFIAELNQDIETLESEGQGSLAMHQIVPAPVECLITAVGFVANDERRRLIVNGEEACLVVETSLRTAEIRITVDRL